LSRRPDAVQGDSTCDDGGVNGWVCPSCERHFARQGQSHDCEPAMTIEEYFSTGPPHERPVFDAVVAHLRTLGPIHIEPVSVGIFIKKAGSFVELRPMTKWVAMSFPLPRRVVHPLIARKPIVGARRTYHVVNLHGPEDLTDDVKDWLAESYAFVD
jgi:hypothetical protein